MTDIKNSLSVVVPIFNEIEIIDELIQRLEAACSKLNREYEIILVDDGSSDGTFERIKEASLKNSNLRYVSFSRNFGHQMAVSAGIDASTGSGVMVMDGDLQDPPEIIPQFISEWERGSDVVYAVRKKRKENLFYKACYFLFYRLLQHIADIPIPPDSGDFCLMDKKVVDLLKKMPERNRFVRGIRAWVGFKQTPLEYERDRRSAGSPKYTFSKLVKLATDGIAAYSQFPLRLCGYLGYTFAAISVLGLGYSFISKFWTTQTPRGWSSITFAIFFIGGVQLVMLSVVGNYIGRIYTEVQQRPLYIVKETNCQPDK